MSNLSYSVGAVFVKTPIRKTGTAIWLLHFVILPVFFLHKMDVFRCVDAIGLGRPLDGILTVIYSILSPV